MSRRRRREDGFTLIEAIVALGVLALAIALVARTFAGGWSAVRHGGLESRAIAVAKARLEGVGIETPIAAGTTSGEDGGVRWKMQIAPYTTSGQPSAKARLSTWWVRVDVDWRDSTFARERTLSLVTVKLGDRAP